MRYEIIKVIEFCQSFHFTEVCGRRAPIWIAGANEWMSIDHGKSFCQTQIHNHTHTHTST